MEEKRKSDIQEDIIEILSDFDTFLDNVFESPLSSPDSSANEPLPCVNERPKLLIEDSAVDLDEKAKVNNFKIAKNVFENFSRNNLNESTGVKKNDSVPYVDKTLSKLRTDKLLILKLNSNDRPTYSSSCNNVEYSKGLPKVENVLRAKTSTGEEKVTKISNLQKMLLNPREIQSSNSSQPIRSNSSEHLDKGGSMSFLLGYQRRHIDDRPKQKAFLANKPSLFRPNSVAAFSCFSSENTEDVVDTPKVKPSSQPNNVTSSYFSKPKGQHQNVDNSQLIHFDNVIKQFNRVKHPSDRHIDVKFELDRCQSSQSKETPKYGQIPNINGKSSIVVGMASKSDVKLSDKTPFQNCMQIKKSKVDTKPQVEKSYNRPSIPPRPPVSTTAARRLDKHQANQERSSSCPISLSEEEDAMQVYIHDLLSSHSAKIAAGIMSVEHRGTKALELWARRATQGYDGVNVSNMTTSWRDGLAFCALIHHFRPDLIDLKSLKSENILENNALAFRVAEQHLGIPALLDAEDMVETEIPDRLSILTYVSQFYQAFSALGLIGPGGKRNPNAANNAKNTSNIAPVSPAKPAPIVASPRAKSISQPPTTLQTKTETGFKTDKVTVGVRGRREECVVCHKVVFLAERMMVGFPGQLRHRTCFRCDRCSTQLTLASYYETEKGQFCCETCPDEERSISSGEESFVDDNRARVSQSVTGHKEAFSSDSESDSDSSTASDSDEGKSPLLFPRTAKSLSSKTKVESGKTPPQPLKARTVFLHETLTQNEPHLPPLTPPAKPPRSDTQLAPSPTNFNTLSPAIGENAHSSSIKDFQDDPSGSIRCDKAKGQETCPPGNAMNTEHNEITNSNSITNSLKLFEKDSFNKRDALELKGIDKSKEISMYSSNTSDQKLNNLTELIERAKEKERQSNEMASIRKESLLLLDNSNTTSKLSENYNSKQISKLSKQDNSVETKLKGGTNSQDEAKPVDISKSKTISQIKKIFEHKGNTKPMEIYVSKLEHKAAESVIVKETFDTDRIINVKETVKPQETVEADKVNKISDKTEEKVKKVEIPDSKPIEKVSKSKSEKVIVPESMPEKDKSQILQSKLTDDISKNKLGQEIIPKNKPPQNKPIMKETSKILPKIVVANIKPIEGERLPRTKTKEFEVTKSKAEDIVFPLSKPQEVEVSKCQPKEDEFSKSKPKDVEFLINKPKEVKGLIGKPKDVEDLFRKPKEFEIPKSPPNELEIPIILLKELKFSIDKPKEVEVLINKLKGAEVPTSKAKEVGGSTSKANEIEVTTCKNKELDVPANQTKEVEVPKSKTENVVVVSKDNSNKVQVPDYKLNKVEVSKSKPKEVVVPKSILKTNETKPEEIKLLEEKSNRFFKPGTFNKPNEFINFIGQSNVETNVVDANISPLDIKPKIVNKKIVNPYENKLISLDKFKKTDTSSKLEGYAIINDPSKPEEFPIEHSNPCDIDYVSTSSGNGNVKNNTEVPIIISSSKASIITNNSIKEAKNNAPINNPCEAEEIKNTCETEKKKDNLNVEVPSLISSKNQNLISISEPIRNEVIEQGSNNESNTIVYPDELNPFDSDSEMEAKECSKQNKVVLTQKEKEITLEIKETPTEKIQVENEMKNGKKLLKAPYNPFDTDDEEIEPTNQSSIADKTKLKQSLNPFWSEDEDPSIDSISPCKSKIKPPRPPPPTLKRDAVPPKKRIIAPNPTDLSFPPSPSLSCKSSSSDQSTLRLKKKQRHAPAPPSADSSPYKGKIDSVPLNASALVAGNQNAREDDDEALSLKMQKDFKNHTNKLMGASSKVDDQSTITMKTGIATPKSEKGEWRRKKGPAPLRPVPQKRAIRKLPMRQVQQELHDIDVKQTELERQGVLLETAIRERTEKNPTDLTPGEDSGSVTSLSTNSDVDKSCSSINSSYGSHSGMEVEDMILQLFELVNEKNDLFRRQTELMYLKREKRLEEEYAELEFQIRCLMHKPHSERSEEDNKQEEDLIGRLVKVVEQRDAVVNCLEMERQREALEDESIASHMIKYQEKHIEGIDSDEGKETLKKKKKKRLRLLKKKKKVKDREKSSKIDADKDVDETEIKKEKKKKKNWFKKPLLTTSAT